MTSFSLYVSYAQVAVFDSALEQPFNDWTERHIQQGFSWRPGSVSFATIEEAAPHLVTIDVADGGASVSEEAIRVIETPFHVPQNGSIEIASISESFVTDLPFGLYALRFSYFLATALSEFQITFQFIKPITRHSQSCVRIRACRRELTICCFRLRLHNLHARRKAGHLCGQKGFCK